jgi:hypothetical protein
MPYSARGLGPSGFSENPLAACFALASQFRIHRSVTFGRGASRHVGQSDVTPPEHLPQLPPQAGWGFFLPSDRSRAGTDLRPPGLLRRRRTQMKQAGAPHLNPAIRRRALVLLSSCPEGCTKAVLAAHNISDNIVRRLIRSGLAVAHTEASGGENGLENSRVRITEAGKRLLPTQART